MQYVVSIKNAQNDIQALINLDDNRKKQVIPLIHTTGEINSKNSIDKINKKKLKKDHIFKTFLLKWGNYEFMLDPSRLSEKDIKSPYNEYYNLHDPSNGYLRKFEYFEKIRMINNNFIPVVGWNENDTSLVQDIFQFFLKLQDEYSKIAIHINIDSQTDFEILKNLLEVKKDTASLNIILNFKSIENKCTDELSSKIYRQISLLSNRFGPLSFITMSSSFPSSKPSYRDKWKKTENRDIILYTQLKTKIKDSKIIYGDYGATSPNSAIEFIPGMKIIPSITYYSSRYWYQIKSGEPQEYSKFIELAKKIREEDFYHGDKFCWATKKIKEIASKSKNEPGSGTQGTWNGYKINQHICAILEEIK